MVAVDAEAVVEITTTLEATTARGSSSNTKRAEIKGVAVPWRSYMSAAIWIRIVSLPCKGFSITPSATPPSTALYAG